MSKLFRIEAPSGGFTLVELLATMAVLSIVMAISAPSLSSFAANQRLRGTSTDLVTTLVTARSEAIKRNTLVTVTAAADGEGNNWGRGWTATASGGVQIDRKQIEGGVIEGSTAPVSIVFDGSGRMTTAGGASIQFRDGRGDTLASPRCISIDLAGRPQTKVGACT
jgi:type IV fimbrial biogenesis protein FimT